MDCEISDLVFGVCLEHTESEEYMKYSINVNEVKTKEGNIKGFATVVFGDAFKITNIAILENPERQQLFVSMPRYRSSEHDENGGTIYKDVCNPITQEFREELYDNIIEAYETVKTQAKEQGAHTPSAPQAEKRPDTAFGSGPRNEPASDDKPKRKRTRKRKKKPTTDGAHPAQAVKDDTTLKIQR